MKKQVVIIVSLIVLVGLLFGGYLFAKNYKENQDAEEAEEAAALQLVNFNSSDINKVTLEIPDGTYTANMDENGSWSLEEETDFTINAYFLNSVTGSLCNLTASENLGTATEEIKQQYELDEPYIITLSTASDSRTLYTGKLTATSEYYYVMTDASDDVFLVDADYGDYLRPTQNSLKSIYVQTDQYSQIERMYLIRDGETIFDLQKKDENTWEMTEPIASDYVNVANISNLQTDILQLIIDKFGDDHITEDQYAEYGFDDPMYTFYFSQDGGAETTIYAKAYDTDSTEFVECLQKETGQIFYCAANYISFLQAESADFLSSTIYDVDMEEVSQVEVHMDGEDMTLELDAENEQYTANGIDVDALGTDAVDALTTFYDNLTGLVVNSLYLTDTVPETEPEVTIIYTLTDGTTETITFVEKDSESDYVLRNGEYSGFLADRSLFTSRTGILEIYNRLKKAIGLSTSTSEETTTSTSTTTTTSTSISTTSTTTTATLVTTTD